MATGTIARHVNRRSNTLIAEFRKHLAEVQQANPEFTDEGKIFEGWAIQKLAGLQLMIVRLEARFAGRDEERAAAKFADHLDLGPMGDNR